MNPEPVPETIPVKPLQRMTALDSLRGLAVLMMTLSGIIPFDKPLPAWMYHAQEPPPSHEFIATLPGLTWVDLVFPIFLFSMGAAIPIAMERKFYRNHSSGKIVGATLFRGAVLAWYGVYLQHIRPDALSANPTAQTWLTALLGFILLFLMYVRLPENIPQKVRFLITGAGFVGGALLMWNLRYPKGSYSFYFTPARNDIIIMVLANMAVFGTLAWLATKNRTLARLSILPLYLGLRLSATQPGWVQDVWKYTPAFGDEKPIAFLFNWDWLKYLFIVIPGTIVGDQIVRWMKSAPTSEDDSTSTETKNSVKWVTFVALCALMILTLLAGLEGRHLWQTTAITLCIALALIQLSSAQPFRLFPALGRAETGASSEKSKRALTPTEELIHTFMRWAGYWLLLGLFFEPFEGGIKKDHSTISYYFVTVGIAIYALSSFIVFSQIFRLSKLTSLLTAVGQNPMIGYCAMGNLIQPLLGLTTLDILLAKWTPDPWAGVFKAVCETLAMALFVALCTRMKLFWRT